MSQEEPKIDGVSESVIRELKEQNNAKIDEIASKLPQVLEGARAGKGIVDLDRLLEIVRDSERLQQNKDSK